MTYTLDAMIRRRLMMYLTPTMVATVGLTIPQLIDAMNGRRTLTLWQKQTIARAMGLAVGGL